MAKIRSRRRDDLQVRRVVDLYTGESGDRTMLDRVPPAELHHQSVGYYFPGGPDECQLFEVRCDPDKQFNPHAHEEDEIMFVLEGELHLGRQVFYAGSALFIPGRTLYAFRSGPEGLTFLNFRPRADRTYISRAELVAARNLKTDELA
jgi:mannose-6-phosphate isomerase-like protein (cupin superfamily)